MAKKISVALSVLATCLLVFVLLFTSMEWVMNDTSFVGKEYRKIPVAKEMGISNDDLMLSYGRLIDYMQGKVPDIGVIVTINGEKVHMFTDEQEISHMQDVRTLYQRIEGYRDIAVIVMLVLYTASAVFALKTAAHSIAKGCMIGIFVVLMPLGFIATWAALDFSNFWDVFHEALFWNEDWLFPAESRLIQMLPEQFFMDMVFRIVMIAGAILVLLLVVSCIVIIATHKREERDYEKALEAVRKKRRREKKREEVLQRRKMAKEIAGTDAKHEKKHHKHKETSGGTEVRE